MSFVKTHWMGKTMQPTINYQTEIKNGEFSRGHRSEAGSFGSEKARETAGKRALGFGEKHVEPLEMWALWARKITALWPEYERFGLWITRQHGRNGAKISPRKRTLICLERAKIGPAKMNG